MVHSKHIHLTRRERQIMDVLYARREASAADIQAGIPEAPSYSAVRALLRKLMDKGHVTFRQDGARYVYRPVLPKTDAKRGAVQSLINTFFDGDRASAVVNLLGANQDALSDADIAAIEAQLEAVKAHHRQAQPHPDED